MCEMQFISQLLAFENLSGGLTMQAQMMYYKLFMYSNHYGLGRAFYVTNEFLIESTKIRSKDTFAKARNQLVQEGLIEYTPGKKGRASAYRILDLTSIVDNLAAPVDNEKSPPDISPNKGGIRDESGTNPGRNPGQIRDESGAELGHHKDKDIDKDIDKDVAKKRKARFVPPTLDEVNAYILEKRLHVSAKQFLDYFSEGGWVDSKGNSVRNWKQKLLTWEKYADKEKQDRPMSVHEQTMANAQALMRKWEEEENTREREDFGDINAVQ